MTVIHIIKNCPIANVTSSLFSLNFHDMNAVKVHPDIVIITAIKNLALNSLSRMCHLNIRHPFQIFKIRFNFCYGYK